MRFKNKAIVCVLLFLACLFIHIYSLNPSRVESHYSTGIFITISRALRTLFGSIPFSAGDILYGIGVGWVLWKLGKWILAIIQKRKPKADIFINRLYKTFFILTGLYIVFNLAWGINYNRKGIAWQLGLNMDKYSTAELREINCIIIEKLNHAKRTLVRQGNNLSLIHI